MLVLLWGLPADGPLAAVHNGLLQAGVPTRLIDQRDVLQTQVRLSIGEELHASVQIGDQELALAEVTAVYVRAYESRRLPHIIEAGDAAWQQAAEVDDVMGSWCSMTPALVVNPFDAMASNSSKPYQLEQIRRLGWRVPETLVTTDPALAKAFWEQHGTVIYKSVGASRSRVARLQAEHLERFDSIASCPTQFQQFIAGTDFRVHVVGDEVFACEIESKADDYRFEGGALSRAVGQLPREVEDACRALACALGLWLAGIDVRRTPEGEWVCFEVNTSPAFTCFETEGAGTITQAVVRLLVRGVEHAADGMRQVHANR